MENKSHALVAGAFVVAVAALLVAMAMWLARDVTNTSTYEMTSNEAVNGLQAQAAVRYKGVTVGKVTRIGFDPAQRGNVLVTMAIDPNAPITRSTFATLAFQGVTGLSFVQLDEAGSSTETPEPGPNGVPRIPLRAGALGQITDQAGQLIDQVSHAAERLNELLAAENQAVLRDALTAVGAAAQSTSALARTTEQTLQAQFDPKRLDLPALTAQAQATLQAAEEAARQAQQVIGSLAAVISEAQRGLARVTGADGMLDRIDRGANTVTGTTLPRIQNLTSDASRTIRRLDRIADTLSENPQALLYGSGAIDPGPGEPGFVPPTPSP